MPKKLLAPRQHRITNTLQLLDMMRGALYAHPYHISKLVLVISVVTYGDCLSALLGWNIFGRDMRSDGFTEMGLKLSYNG